MKVVLVGVNMSGVSILPMIGGETGLKYSTGSTSLISGLGSDVAYPENADAVDTADVFRACPLANEAGSGLR
jgi:hypothetical protein